MIYEVKQDMFDGHWYVVFEDGGDIYQINFYGHERMARDYAEWMNKGVEARLCLGYNGGCDGDLIGLSHEDHCPAKAFRDLIAA